MRPAIVVGALVLVGGGVLGACLLAAPADVVAAGAPARTHEVVIQGFAFIPETLTVRPGDTVVWINKDPLPHSATAAGVFDSGSIAAGKSWRFAARKAGSYAYLCTLHTTMKGTLKVE